MPLKYAILNFFLLVSLLLYPQIEKPIKLTTCSQEQAGQLEKCFVNTIAEQFYANFLEPANSQNPTFRIFFSATKEAAYEILYISTEDSDILKEVNRVFALFPDFQPATFEGRKLDKQYMLYYPETEAKITEVPLITKKSPKPPIGLKKLVNVPLSLENNDALSTYVLAADSHTGFKPYIFEEVAKYGDLDSLNQDLFFDKSSWGGRKLWNEHLFQYESAEYWFEADPVIDLQVGKVQDVKDYTYLNTRGFRFQGGFSDKLGFSTTIYENQGRFAPYINAYALSKRPFAEAYAVVPSRDISKEYQSNAFDFPLATGYVSAQPFKFMNVQFGHDKNFIGDGYRSLFLSDEGAPYTFLKIQTTFWKLQYTNLWTWLRDVNTETADGEPYKRKYMALHHLSWNATKNLNIGLFESVIWAKTEEQGFDPQYLNPVILYRAIEYENGSRAGNALLGLNVSYKLWNTAKIYGQFLLDELTFSEFFKDSGYWANKYGFQLGGTYYNVFKVPNLSLQVEYNQVRPFTYSHNNAALNYGHVNQALAHNWESNFREFIFKTDFQKDRWFGHLKLISGVKGFDFSEGENSFSYGGNIFRSNSEKNAVFGVNLTQGNKADILIGELQAGYLVNPSSRLKLFGSILYRDFNSAQPNLIYENGNTLWFSLGLRTDILNWYWDF